MNKSDIFMKEVFVEFNFLEKVIKSYTSIKHYESSVKWVYRCLRRLKNKMLDEFGREIYFKRRSTFDMCVNKIENLLKDKFKELRVKGG